MTTKKLTLLAIGFASFGLAGAAAHAASAFLYTPGDLLLGFRSTGTNDFVVDLGPASQFYSATPGSTISISQYSGSQLRSVVSSLDGLTFSIFGDVRTAGDPSHPMNSLWMSRARSGLDAQSTPWYSQSLFAQGNAGSKIDAIASGAVTYSGTTAADPVRNTPTAVTVDPLWDAGSALSYTIGIGDAGNLAGTFPGNIENTTPSGFAASGVAVRSDLYELIPGRDATGNYPTGKYLGYFELTTDGGMSFTAVPEPSSTALASAALALFLGRNYLRRKN